VNGGDLAEKQCDTLLLKLLRTLADVEAALRRKTISLQQSRDFQSALYEIEHQAWETNLPIVQSTGVAIEGYVEGTASNTGRIWLWKFDATFKEGETNWSVERRVEYSGPNDEWELVHDFRRESLADTVQLVETLPSLVDELLLASHESPQPGV
jgi:hypothetical protein